MNQLATEARALCERATKGPWTLIKEGRYEDHDECRIDLPDDNIELCRYENGDLVARSRTLLPEMAAEIERLEAALSLECAKSRIMRPVTLDGQSAENFCHAIELGEMREENKRLQAELDALKSLLRSKRLVSVDSVLDIIGEIAAEALAAMKEDAHE